MAAANFAVSRELPPPTPITASAPVSRARRAVSAAPVSCGFGSTAPKTAFTAGTLSLSASACGAKCRPQAITARSMPSDASTSAREASFPAPKCTCTASE